MASDDDHGDQRIHADQLELLHVYRSKTTSILRVAAVWTWPLLHRTRAHDLHRWQSGDRRISPLDDVSLRDDARVDARCVATFRRNSQNETPLSGDVLWRNVYPETIVAVGRRRIRSLLHRSFVANRNPLEREIVGTTTSNRKYAFK